MQAAQKTTADRELRTLAVIHTIGSSHEVPKMNNTTPRKITGSLKVIRALTAGPERVSLQDQSARCNAVAHCLSFDFLKTASVAPSNGPNRFGLMIYFMTEKLSYSEMLRFYRKL
jgi:hypothetical protein